MYEYFCKQSYEYKIRVAINELTNIIHAFT